MCSILTSKVLLRYLRFCTADCLLCDSKCSSFPAVFQVVGVKDERMGEEICACIKLVDGADCTAEEIKAYCKGQVGHSSRLIFHNELELLHHNELCSFAPFRSPTSRFLVTYSL